MQDNRKTLHWKAKKYIIQGVCALVLTGTMGISLLGQSSGEKDTLEKEEARVDGQQIAQTATSTNLYMDNSVVEKDTTETEKRARLEGGSTENVQGDAVGNEGDSANKTIENSFVAGNQSSTGDNKTKSVTRKTGRSGKGNKVVKNVSRQSAGTAANRVVENPEPMHLIEGLFENHGTAPQMSNLVQKYQFPIEIGYAIDKNYDGKNSAGDLILNKIYDTEDINEDSDGQEDSSEEDVGEASGDASTEEDIEVTSGDTDVAEEDGESVDADVAEEEPVEKTEEVAETEDSQEEDIQDTASGEAEKDVESVSGNSVGSKDIETQRLETYRKSVWKKVLATAPESVEMKAQQGRVIVTEEVAEGKDATGEDVSKVSGDAIDEASGTVEGSVSESADNVSGDATEQLPEEVVSADSQEVVEKEINTGYYIVKGKMREDSDIFVSDIEIIPAGVDGFDEVRLGEDGEFANSLLITEDAVDKDVELYFTDGEQVTEATTFTYSKDTVNPELQMSQEGLQMIQSAGRTIYCTNQSDIKLTIEDGQTDVKDTLSKVQFLYGDQLKSVEDGWDDPKITIEDDFYGRLLLNCKDKAGNVSDMQSQFVLIDHNQPEITIAQDTRCSAPYTLWTTVSEVGHIVSGIQSIQCVVNDEIYDVTDAVVNETFTLDEGLEVSSKVTFPIDMDKTGTYTVYIRVLDYAGNETVIEKTVEVTDPELVSVYMPRNFTIHIDPQQLAGREQIYSDNVELKNVSEFDVCVQIDEVILNVNDEVSDEGVLKDCDIYLVAPDTGEKIKLSKGSNKNIYSYRLPPDANGDITNLLFVGTTTEGSEAMWKGSDISIRLKLSFHKWEE